MEACFSVHSLSAHVTFVDDERFVGFAGQACITVPIAPGNREYDELIAREIPVGACEPPPVDLIAYAAHRHWEIVEAATVNIVRVGISADEVTRNVVTAARIPAS